MALSRLKRVKCAASPQSDSGNKTVKLLWRLTRFFGCWAIAGLCGLLMVLTSAYLYLSPKLPGREVYTNIRLENPLRIYTADNKLLAEFGSRRSNPIKYDQIPSIIVNALISSEDKRFYQHDGVDTLGLVRSVAGIITGNDWGGGSTITMQVTKNFFFEGESAYSRKFKEILLALKMERDLSKEEIIELYLNRTFFGVSAYGIVAASRQYYNKEIDQLTLPEVATLVGILPRPNAYNPLQSPERALTERRRVLARMLDQKMISRADYDVAMTSPETASRYGRQPELAAPYVAEMVRLEMIERYGEKALTDGFEVYTTIDSHLQQAADEALNRGLETYDRNHGYRGPESHLDPTADGSVDAWLQVLAATPSIADQHPAIVQAVGNDTITALMRDGSSVTLPWEGIRWAKRFITASAWGSTPKNAAEVAKVGDLIRVTQNDQGQWMLGQVPAVNSGLVSLDPHDGAILALVGGYDFNANSFNRVTQAKRQPGSNFKPFLYTAALANGYTAATLINDAPLARADYRPSNFDGEFMGPIRLKYALTQSKNLVSLRLYEALGQDKALPYIGRFGFKADEIPRNDLTVAIGSYAVLPLEVATGYAVLANGGYKVSPYAIDRIINFNDGEVFKATPATVCSTCNVPAQDAVGTNVPAAAVAAAPVMTTSASSALEDALHQPADAPALPAAPRVIDARTAYIMNTILKAVTTEGSGRAISRTFTRKDLAGKTGTTNDNKDLWFSGFNGDVETTVYVGYDQPMNLGDGEQAATVALPIWIDYMKQALEGRPESSMAQPDGLVTVRINSRTGLRAAPGEPGTIFEVFKEEEVPPYGNAARPGSRSSQSGSSVESIF
jgi:penicillin-binding protein 1A